MNDPNRTYEIRCPVHGFIPYDSWERDIIEQPWFQRLRRIKQLAWTDHIYPGASHSRFEHTLGVMHTATLLFDGIVQRSGALLASELSYRPEGLQRHRALIRIAALLHDVGHGPFSHAGETLLPRKRGTPGESDDEATPRYEHEEYSAEIVRRCFKDVIDNHPMNTNYGLRADDVASLLEGSAGAGKALFWRGLISGQMDADRMDYLLRDSHHLGVHYGRFDLHRVANTIQAVVRPSPAPLPGADALGAVHSNSGLALGVSRDGWHAVEALILARYFMFTQVYFHRTRVAFDHHLRQALQTMLPDEHFPPPDRMGLDEFHKWDDWLVLGKLAAGHGGEHGERLSKRNHYRLVYQTPEATTKEDLIRLERVQQVLGPRVRATELAEKSWYKLDQPQDILIAQHVNGRVTERLSRYSSVVANLRPNSQVLLYADKDEAEEARRMVEEVERETK